MNNRVTILSVISLLLIVGVIGGMFWIFNKIELPVGDENNETQKIETPSNTEKPGDSSNNTEKVQPTSLTKGPVGYITQGDETIFYLTVEPEEVGDPYYCTNEWFFGIYENDVTVLPGFPAWYRYSLDGGATWKEFGEGSMEDGRWWLYAGATTNADVMVSYAKVKNCTNAVSMLEVLYENMMKNTTIESCRNCYGAGISFDFFSVYTIHVFEIDRNNGYFG